MGRQFKPLHQLQLRRDGKLAACSWLGTRWYFGAWDIDRNCPSEEALAKFQQQVATWRVDPKAGQVEAGNRYLVELWADWIQAGGVPNRQEDLRRCAEHLFGTSKAPGPYLMTTVHQFGKPQLAAWRDHLCALQHNGRARFGTFMVNLYLSFILRCFQWGEERGLVHEERVASLLRVKKAAGLARAPVKRRGVAWELIEATLPHLPAPPRLAVQLLWLTCARPGEVLGLRCEQIRRGGKLVTDHGTPIDLDRHGVWAAVLGEHKTSDTDYDRVLFFGPKSQELLQPLLGRGGYLIRPSDSFRRGVERETFTRRGETYDAHGLARAVKRACQAKDLQHWTPYQIRHRVFRLVQAEHGRDAARSFGGHTVGGATEDYAGADLNTAARVAAAWG